MANFRGTIRGARGEASRLGHSRLDGRVAGWHIGVELSARKTETGDEISVLVDQGNGMDKCRMFYLGTVKESDAGPIWIPSEFAVAQVIADNRAGSCPGYSDDVDCDNDPQDPCENCRQYAD